MISRAAEPKQIAGRSMKKEEIVDQAAAAVAALTKDRKVPEEEEEKQESLVRGRLYTTEKGTTWGRDIEINSIDHAAHLLYQIVSKGSWTPKGERIALPVSATNTRLEIFDMNAGRSALLLIVLRLDQYGTVCVVRLGGILTKYHRWRKSVGKKQLEAFLEA